MMRTLVLAALVAMGMAISGQRAQAVSLDGEWSGKGYVQPTQGAREQVHCRVRYTRQSGRVFSVVATCATSSFKIRQTGEVLMVTPTRYVGDFHNAEFDVSGRIRVIVAGTRQTVTLSGRAGQGSLTLSK
ncbi:MAG: hypothetical protein NW217_06200 [Hyphomicrobiaceae bacterium]|nr:hypothetical protein [Hyphomicrobiaceae bacterium]